MPAPAFPRSPQIVWMSVIAASTFSSSETQKIIWLPGREPAPSERSPAKMRIEYIMTDPQMWEGEWRSVKEFDRADYTDINEAVCILQYNRNLPGTNLGRDAAEDRGKSEIEGVADE